MLGSTSLFFWFFVFARIVPLVTAGTAFCSNLAPRQEWRDLTNDAKRRYIDAVKCLQARPAQGLVKAARTRFDDFQAVHINLTDEVHLVGQFLPWHRRFLNVFEETLRSECNFSGALPYWDWSRDVDVYNKIDNSPVFDPVHGFGGNGIYIPGWAGPFNNLTNLAGWVPGTGGGCITTGPFASYNLSLGPGTIPTNHCITRDFNDAFAWALSSAQVANTTKQPTFENFRIELEGQPITPTMKLHDGGPLCCGGRNDQHIFKSRGCVYNPVFYLHHANLDRIWWNWQQLDLPHRLFDVSGRSSVDPPFVNITLAFELKMLNLAPLVPIRDIMDPRSEPLCYRYV
ncbi:Tyrosinase central domain-containing protein [Mycena sanguinolenta]|uniref:Tyrosinase central domain-containing protein n=1 Tax=Mycena sanguinolenta TaxID=230812 RepID=A0A8H7CJP5_9AGAR|nr:Tyrosinase central domain-containing protein [Mycena sanguinolenta]